MIKVTILKRLNIIHFKETQLLILRLSILPHKCLFPCFLSHLIKSNSQLAYKNSIQYEKNELHQKFPFMLFGKFAMSSSWCQSIHTNHIKVMHITLYARLYSWTSLLRIHYFPIQVRVEGQCRQFLQPHYSITIPH